MTTVRQQSVLAAIVAVLSVCLVGIGIFFLWLRSYDLAYIADWRRAETCAAAADATAANDCTATTEGRVSAVHLDFSPPELDLAVGPTAYKAYFQRSQRAGLASLKTGDSVPIELWRGHVIQVRNEQSFGNPNEIDPSSTDIRYAIGTILAGAIGGPFIVYLLLRERRRLQRLVPGQGRAQS
jgi:hypothetical protein